MNRLVLDSGAAEEAWWCSYLVGQCSGGWFRIHRCQGRGGQGNIGVSSPTNRSRHSCSVRRIYCSAPLLALLCWLRSPPMAIGQANLAMFIIRGRFVVRFS
uniref:Uncharacterized protein n=1 Tax=Arundo donax TaxID=35708 RepID=A0A0A9FTS4_ARUDO